jgi:hypothetical protein
MFNWIFVKCIIAKVTKTDKGMDIPAMEALFQERRKNRRTRKARIHASRAVVPRLFIDCSINSD